MLKLYNDASIFYNMRLFDELKRAHSLGTPNASKLYGIFILSPSAVVVLKGAQPNTYRTFPEVKGHYYYYDEDKLTGSHMVVLRPPSTAFGSIRSTVIGNSLSLSILHIHQHAPAFI
jgi:hypothetical protein